MFTMHNRLDAVPGEGDALAALLLEGAAEVGRAPRCLVYLVHRDEATPDAVWVTEVWTDRAAHEASLEDPAVRSVIDRARPLIAGVEPGRPLRTVGGKGI